MDDFPQAVQAQLAAAVQAAVHDGVEVLDPRLAAVGVPDRHGHEQGRHAGAQDVREKSLHDRPPCLGGGE